MKTTTTTLLLALSTCALTSLPLLRADAVTDASVKVAESTAATEETRAEMRAVDARIAELEQLIDATPDSPERASAKQRLDALKERRSELRKQFVKAKYDAFEADVQKEYADFRSWAKKRVAAIKERDDAKEPTAIDRTAAAVNLNANAARANLALYKLAPSPENKDSVKQALKEFKQEIKQLDDFADDLPKGEARDAATRKVKALKERYSELRKDFTVARWDAAVNEVKSFWNEHTS